MIRLINDHDTADLTALVTAAFGTDEGPLIAGLMRDLGTQPSHPQTVLLADFADETPLGTVAFSPVTFDGATDIAGYILAPLAVHPDHQRRGIGRGLIDAGHQILTDQGVDVVLVYGDPDYYGRFGFTADLGARFVPAYPLAYPHGWQAVSLSRCALPQGPLGVTCVPALNDPKYW